MEENYTKSLLTANNASKLSMTGGFIFSKSTAIHENQQT